MEYRITKILSIVLCVYFINCTTKENKIKVFYFDQNFNTPYSVQCNGIYNLRNLKRIVVFNTKEYKLLTNTISQLKDFKSEYNLDVRRQLIINKDTLCFDRIKRVLVNGVRKDSMHSVILYNLVDELINKYDNSATIFNEIPEIILD